MNGVPCSLCASTENTDLQSNTALLDVFSLEPASRYNGQNAIRNYKVFLGSERIDTVTGLRFSCGLRSSWERNTQRSASLLRGG